MTEQRGDCRLAESTKMVLKCFRSYKDEKRQPKRRAGSFKSVMLGECYGIIWITILKFLDC